jgi:hypothetical protein
VRKQNSTKIIQKLKNHKEELVNHKRETSTSTTRKSITRKEVDNPLTNDHPREFTTRKSLTRKETDNSLSSDHSRERKISSSSADIPHPNYPPPYPPHPAYTPTPPVSTVVSPDFKLPPLHAITELKVSEPSINTSLSQALASSSSTPNILRARRSVRTHEDLPKIPLSSVVSRPVLIQQQNGVTPSPLKPGSLFRSNTFGNAISSAILGRSNSMLRSPDTNNENLPPANTAEEKVISTKEDFNTPRVNKVAFSVPEVFQKMSELQRQMSGKDRVMELEQLEMKKQVEEMKGNLDSLVAAVNQLTEKFAS